MEAPDKIYLLRNKIGVVLNSWFFNSDEQLESIEYIRRDALLEIIDEAIGIVKDYIEKTPYLTHSQRPIEVRGKIEAFNEIRALIKEM